MKDNFIGMVIGTVAALVLFSYLKKKVTLAPAEVNNSVSMGVRG